VLRLRRLALIDRRELLLELREEVLPAGHEVWHVACMGVTWAMSSLCIADVPREPQAPLLLFATESPCTLWYADGWSADWALVPVCIAGAPSEGHVPATLSRYSAALVRCSSRLGRGASGAIAKLCTSGEAPLPAVRAYSSSRSP
jgi:hypothetical protein